MFCVWAVDSCSGSCYMACSCEFCQIMSIGPAQPQMIHNEICADCRKLCNWTEFSEIVWISIVHWKCIKGVLMTNRSLKLMAYPQRWWKCKLATISHNSGAFFAACNFQYYWRRLCIFDSGYCKTGWLRIFFLYRRCSKASFLSTYVLFLEACFGWSTAPLTKLSAECDLFSIDPCTSICHITAKNGRVTYIA